MNKIIKITICCVVSAMMVFSTTPAFAANLQSANWEKGKLASVKWPTFTLTRHGDDYTNAYAESVTMKLGEKSNLVDLSKLAGWPSDVSFNCYTTQENGGLQWYPGDNYVVWHDEDFYIQTDLKNVSAEGFVSQAIKEYEMSKTNYYNVGGVKYILSSGKSKESEDDWSFDFIKFCAKQCGILGANYFPSKATSIEDVLTWIKEGSELDQPEQRATSFPNISGLSHTPSIGDIVYNGDHCAIVSNVTINASNTVVECVEGNNDNKLNISSFNFGDQSKWNNFIRLNQPMYLTYDLSNASVEGISDNIYSGQPITFDDIVVKIGNRVVPKNMYDVQYSGNDQPYGKATVTINPASSYSYGSKSVDFNITGVDLSKCSIAGLATQYYAGSACTQPNLYVQINGKTVPKSCYGVTYSKNNVVAGTAAIKISANSGSIGTLDGSFLIRPNLSKATITLASKVYTGKTITQTPTVKIGTLAVSNAYWTATTTNNTNVGTATVKLTAKGGSTGTKSGTFKITASSISAVTLKATTVTYDGKDHKPAISKVTASSGTVPTTGYTISYLRSGKTTTDFKTKGTITVKVTGKNNWTGSKSVSFKIS